MTRSTRSGIVTARPAASSIWAAETGTETRESAAKINNCLMVQILYHMVAEIRMTGRITCIFRARQGRPTPVINRHGPDHHDRGPGGGMRPHGAPSLRHRRHRVPARDHL